MYDNKQTDAMSGSHTGCRNRTQTGERSQEPDSDKRLIKQLIPPIYNLAIAVRDLFNYVQSNPWKGLDKKKQAKLAKRFKQFSEAVPTASGILKTGATKSRLTLTRMSLPRSTVDSGTHSASLTC